MFPRLRERQEWKFFAGARPGGPPARHRLVVDPRAARPAAGGVRGRDRHVDRLRSRAAARSPARWPRWGSSSSPLQVLPPIHTAVGANLGDRTAAWLYDRLTEASSTPPGMGHLEDPELASDLTVARDFDLGMHRAAAVAVDGLHRRRPGRAARRPRLGGRAVRLRVVGSAACWRGPGSRPTGCCARAASGATATPTRSARPSRTPTTPTGSRSTRRRPRRSGCSGWPTGSSTGSSPAGGGCTSCSTRRPGCASGRCCPASSLVLAANALVFWALAAAADRRPARPRRGGHLRPGGARQLG